MTRASTQHERTDPVSPQVHKRRARAMHLAEAAGNPKMLAVKIVALAIIDAIAVYAAMVLFGAGHTLTAAIVVLFTIAVNVVYLKPGLLPAKYLTPGLIFLLVFQVFVVLYTIYIAFTNYGSGHNASKEDAVNALLLQNQTRISDTSYPISVLEQNGTFFLLRVDPDTGDAQVGTTDEPFRTVDGATIEGDRAVAAPGFRTLNFGEIVGATAEITALTVPVSDDSDDGYIKTTDGSNAYMYQSDLAWDPEAGTLTDRESGTVYSDRGNGKFEADDGSTLRTGWVTTVGFENFVKAFTEESIRGPFIAVTIWTFAFAALSVATTFALGLFLAVVFNDPKMKSKKFYRIIMILPYAFPAFLSALVWAGMFNQDFGFINQSLFGGAPIPWLSDAWLAKIAVLIVNLWLGFPYMFLVCTGAIQSIPEDITEAGRMDGANAWQIFRSIKFPLLLVSVAPLLISSFAFNFNNFNLIFMLTRGGPRFTDASINAGATDILISMVYKVAFVGQLSDYGLASAFSIIIFILVGGISYVSFRQTKVLEELN